MADTTRRTRAFNDSERRRRESDPQLGKIEEVNSEVDLMRYQFSYAKLARWVRGGVASAFANARLRLGFKSPEEKKK